MKHFLLSILLLLAASPGWARPTMEGPSYLGSAQTVTWRFDTTTEASPLFGAKGLCVATFIRAGSETVTLYQTTASTATGGTSIATFSATTTSPTSLTIGQPNLYAVSDGATAGGSLTVHCSPLQVSSSGGAVNVPFDTDGDGLRDAIVVQGDYNGDGYANAVDVKDAIDDLTDTDQSTVVVRGMFGVSGLVAATQSGTPLVTIGRDNLTIQCSPGSGIAGFDETAVPDLSADTPLVYMDDKDGVIIDGCTIDGDVDASYSASTSLSHSGIEVRGGTGNVFSNLTIKDTDGHCLYIRSNTSAGVDTASGHSLTGSTLSRCGKRLASNLGTGPNYDHAVYLFAELANTFVEDFTARGNVCTNPGGGCFVTDASGGSSTARVRESLFVDNQTSAAATGNTDDAAAYYFSGSEDITVRGGVSRDDHRAIRVGTATTSYCSTGSDDDCTRGIRVSGLRVLDVVSSAVRLADYAEDVDIDISIEGGAAGYVIDSPSQNITIGGLIRNITGDAVAFAYASGDISRLTFDGLTMEGVGGFGLRFSSTTLANFNDLAIRDLRVDDPGTSVLYFGNDVDVLGFTLQGFWVDLADVSGDDVRFLDVDAQTTGQGQFKDVVIADGVVIDCRSTSECLKIGRWGADVCTGAGAPNACCTGVDQGPTCGDSGPGSLTNIKLVWDDLDPRTGAGVQGIDFQDQEVPSGNEWHVSNVTCDEPPSIHGVAPGVGGFDCVGSVGIAGHMTHEGFTSNSFFVEDEDPLANATDVCVLGQLYQDTDPAGGGASALYACEAAGGFTGL